MTMHKVHETIDVELPLTSKYTVTERNMKVKNTYTRYDRLLCIGVLDGYDGLALRRVVDVSWYRAATTRYPSVKANAIIYCHVYVKGVGHSWGYCGGTGDDHMKATCSMQDALDRMGVVLYDADGKSGGICGCGAAPVISAVRGIARKAEPAAIALEVFD